MNGGVVPGGMMRRSVSQMDGDLRHARLDLRPGVEEDLDDSHAVAATATRCARCR